MLFERIKTPDIPVPDNLYRKIQVETNIQLSGKELRLFTIALARIGEYVSKYKVSLPDSPVGCFFLKDDSLQLIVEPGHYGAFFPMLIYPVYRWRNDNLSELEIFVSMLEELCHWVYNVSDENYVKYRVVDVAKLQNPLYTHAMLYPGWDFAKGCVRT